MENTKKNCENIWKIWKKYKLKSDTIGKIRKKIVKGMENTEEYIEKI
jgi:hypothetical protein